MPKQSPMGRTVSQEKGGITSFRRLRACPKAVIPSDLEAALLKPVTGNDVSASLPERQAQALAEVDWLAEAINWLDIPHWRCTEELAFILALDQHDPVQRLRTSICRAFRQADQWAGTFAQQLDDLTIASRHRRALEKALLPLRHPEGSLWRKNHARQYLFPDSTIGQALEVVARWRRLGEKEEDAIARHETIAQGLAELETMIDVLSRMERSVPIRGRTPDDARFFFTMRLAEFYALSTGQCPDFSDEYRKTKPHWNAFIRAALTLTGLGTQGLDGLLRRLGGVGNSDIGHRKHEPSYGDRLKSLSETFVKGGFLERFPHRDAHHGDLTTSGWLNDFALSDEAST